MDLFFNLFGKEFGVLSMVQALSVVSLFIVKYMCDLAIFVLLLQNVLSL